MEDARRAGTQVPACGLVVELVLGLSSGDVVGRSAQRRVGSASNVRPDLPAGRHARRGGGRHREAGFTSHAATCLRDSLAASGLRHPHGTVTARPCGRSDDDDLHACPQGRRQRRQESAERHGVSRSKADLRHCRQLAEMEWTPPLLEGSGSQRGWGRRTSVACQSGDSTAATSGTEVPR